MREVWAGAAVTDDPPWTEAQCTDATVTRVLVATDAPPQSARATTACLPIAGGGEYRRGTVFEGCGG